MLSSHKIGNEAPSQSQRGARHQADKESENDEHGQVGTLRAGNIEDEKHHIGNVQDIRAPV